MKSMLHEASSIIKAIEKAWTDSGKPSEFSIKILEEGEKSFLGLSKRPSIVSITFTAKTPDKDRFKEREFQPRKSRYEQTRKQQQAQAVQPERQQQDKSRYQQRADSQDFVKRQQQAAAKIEQAKVAKKPEQMAQVTQANPEESQIWVPEWSNFVSDCLKDLLKSLQFNVGFNTKIEKRALFLRLERPLMDSDEENRALYAGVSYLLMQFLKRKHKRKFRGYQIIISNEPASK